MKIRVLVILYVFLWEGRELQLFCLVITNQHVLFEQRTMKQTVKSQMSVVLTEMTHHGFHGSVTCEGMNFSVKSMMNTSKMTLTFVG